MECPSQITLSLIYGARDRNGSSIFKRTGVWDKMEARGRREMDMMEAASKWRLHYKGPKMLSMFMVGWRIRIRIDNLCDPKENCVCTLLFHIIVLYLDILLYKNSYPRRNCKIAHMYTKQSSALLSRVGRDGIP
jgi:hypothetical protein